MKVINQIESKRIDNGITEVRTIIVSNVWNKKFMVSIEVDGLEPVEVSGSELIRAINNSMDVE